MHGVALCALMRWLCACGLTDSGGLLRLAFALLEPSDLQSATLRWARSQHGSIAAKDAGAHREGEALKGC